MDRNTDLAKPMPFSRLIYLAGFIVLARVVLGFLGLH